MIKSSKLPAMFEVYGKSATPHRCRHCNNLIAFESRKGPYYKCEVYGITQGGGTDWNANYSACGMFNIPLDGRVPVYDQIVRQSVKSVEVDR